MMAFVAARGLRDLRSKRYGVMLRSTTNRRDFMSGLAVRIPTPFEGARI